MDYIIAICYREDPFVKTWRACSSLELTTASPIAVVGGQETCLVLNQNLRKMFRQQMSLPRNMLIVQGLDRGRLFDTF